MSSDNGELVRKGEQEDSTVYIAEISSDGTTLTIAEYDVIIGKAKADANVFVFTCSSSVDSSSIITTPATTEPVTEAVGDSRPSENTSASKTDDATVGATPGERSALSKAGDYLRYTSFSHSGLIEQLKYEGYSTSEATYAADHCGADWKEQALKKALDYLDYYAFSYSGLVEQLEYEGFTSSEAKYGADNCGADWNQQAVKKARQYLEYSSFTRSELIDQLEFEGFTSSQAQYGADHAN